MPQPTSQAEHVAQTLIAHFGDVEASGARPADLVEGYRLAAERVAAWGTHRHWPTLRDNLPAVPHG